MTNDYIRREDAVDAICSECTVDKPTTCSTIIKGDNWCEEVHILLNLPPADVAPIRHSRWIKTADGAECEKCGREAVYQIVDDHWEYEPWCPHCGSKMDGHGES